MLKDELKIKIGEVLDKMGCTEIEFSNGTPSFAVVKFNCPTLISFKANLEGWAYSGIQINNLGGLQKYKIEFKKIEG